VPRLRRWFRGGGDFFELFAQLAFGWAAENRVERQAHLLERRTLGLASLVFGLVRLRFGLGLRILLVAA
jgi:hypothetical protein